MVERNLAKVEVASSSLVIRSERVGRLTHPTVEWPRGEATDCKSVYEGSNPFSTSRSTRFTRNTLQRGGNTRGDWRSGSALP